MCLFVTRKALQHQHYVRNLFCQAWLSCNYSFVQLDLYNFDSVLSEDSSMSWVGSLLGVVVILSLVTITTFTLRRRMCVLKKQYNQEMGMFNVSWKLLFKQFRLHLSKHSSR